jgi:chromosome segregation ATPase
VDTDATVAMLIDRQAGRLTFLPLNRLRTEPTVYPDLRDVRPLIEAAISAVVAAMTKVFGRKLLIIFIKETVKIHQGNCSFNNFDIFKI